MSQKSYGKDTDLLNAVRDCMVRNLSYRLAVEELTKRGFKINEKKYQRIKGYIKRTFSERLETLPTAEFQESIVESIDSIRHLIDILWNIINKAKDDWQKMQAIGMLLNCLVTREKFFDSSHVVASLAKKMRDNDNVSNKGK